MTTISVRLDKQLLKDLSKIEKTWKADRSESIRRLLSNAVASWKLADVLEKLRTHSISLGKAAKECNLSTAEMLAVAKEHGVDWTGYSDEDLNKDISLVR